MKLSAKSKEGANKNGYSKIDILGVKVSSTPITEVMKMLNTQCLMRSKLRPFMVVTVNPEFVMQAQRDEEFRKILNEADLAIADGAGLKLGGVQHIVPGREVVSRLVNSNYRIFYLGGRDEVAEEMVRKYGGMADSGHDDVRMPNAEYRTQNERIIKKINKFEPDVLLVAYGAPWQEKWLNANRQLLKAKVIMGVGGAFDYLAGKSMLPPVWIEHAGLEWLWRLANEPWRWRRQVRLVKFVYLVLCERICGNRR